MGRRNRVPEYDLSRHIITGERIPLSGDANLREYDDDMIDHNDPMQFGADAGIFTSRSAQEIIAANAANAMGLDSASSLGDPIAMSEANDNSDPGKGSDTYGPRNSGR